MLQRLLLEAPGGPRPPHTRRAPCQALRRRRSRQVPHRVRSVRQTRSTIAAAIRSYYDEEQPEIAVAKSDSIDQAGRTLGEIYSTNVFPEMKVTWGTYPDHIGHQDFPGCFRCHDDGHTTEDGETISQDCFTCHSLLAMDEEDPEILELLQP